MWKVFVPAQACRMVTLVLEYAVGGKLIDDEVKITVVAVEVVCVDASDPFNTKWNTVRILLKQHLDRSDLLLQGRLSRGVTY